MFSKLLLVILNKSIIDIDLVDKEFLDCKFNKIILILIMYFGKSARLIISIFTLTFISSCSLFFDQPKGWPKFEIRPISGTKNFPDPKTDYGEGFRDGCGAGWDAVSKGALSDFNSKKVNSVKAVKSSDYDTGWFDGLEQCTYIIDWDVV